MNGKDEHGSVMLEATYCILLSIFVLFFFISFSFFLYQKTLVTIITNEIAHEVSQTYKLRDVTDSSSVTASDIVGIGKYRYLFFTNNFERKNEVRAKTITDVRLSKTSLAKEEGGLVVNVETVADDLGRLHYEVTVKQKYSFLLGGLLNVIGQKEKQTIEVTSYVASNDVLSYANTIKMTKYGINKMEDSLGIVGDILGIVNKAIELLHSIFDD